MKLPFKGEIHIEQVSIWLEEKRVNAKATLKAANKVHPQSIYVNFTPSKELLKMIEKEIQTNFTTE